MKKEENSRPFVLLDNRSNLQILNLAGDSFIAKISSKKGGVGTSTISGNVIVMMLVGSTVVKSHGRTITLAEGQMMIQKEADIVEFTEGINPNRKERHLCLIFSIKDSMIRYFITSQPNIKIQKADNINVFTTYTMHNITKAFGYSMLPYFESQTEIHKGLLRTKVVELLYNIMEAQPDMFAIIMHERKEMRTSIEMVMEQRLTTSVSLPDLAYASGRSLSTFKRDFQKVYNESPAKWIRERRLEKAKELLQTTSLTIMDICYSLGFENTTHFSRIFKEYFGVTPTEMRTKEF
ncbi:MAG: helix-turn-helix transcriptional regulator [Bacteroidales bacterium]|nr:helix-turn-helix transcriptional regulator [Candidatus Scybalousia scybalohippi]